MTSGTTTKKEITSRHLKGDTELIGNRHHSAQAVGRLHEGLDQSSRIEDVAVEPGMSTSCPHRKCKAITNRTPLQFQNKLRLQEARRLMIGEDLNASTAGYRVGYEDPSHFSREYKRFFGDPPMRDVQQLRETKETASA